MVRYLVGDATVPEGTGPRIIVHICNDVGGWGAGFVLALSRRWRSPEQAYRQWHGGGDGEPFELGRVQFVEVEPELWVANVIGQHGVASAGGVAPVRYDAIRDGLERVADFALSRGATIHMPRIGAGLAGGDWSVIERLVEEALSDRGLDVTVYDLPPRC